jgi:hypothetical protein
VSDSAIRAAELRLTVAREAGIPDHAHRLQGDTKAELEADAHRLSTTIRSAAEPEPDNADMNLLIRRSAGR